MAGLHKDKGFDVSSAERLGSYGAEQLALLVYPKEFQKSEVELI
jgi:hypothetical protein